MKRYLFIAAVLLSACVRETVEPEYEDMSDGLVVRAALSETKTAFVSDGGVTRVDWVKGDAIGLYADGCDNLKYIAEESGGTSVFKAASVRLNGEEGAVVHAYYPYGTGGTDYKVPYVSNSWQEYGKAPCDFLYAEGKVADNQVKLNFRHIFAFMKITIPLNLIPEGGDRRGLYITSDEPCSATSSVYDLNKSELEGSSATNIFYIIPSDSELDGEKEVTCHIAILPQPEGAEIKFRQYNSSRYGDCLLTKKVPEGGFQAGHVYNLHITENDEGERMKVIRDFLVSFYNSTNGPNWTRKDNWCSDKPINEWYGVYYSYPDNLQISLPNNNLSGKFPASIGDIPELSYFSVRNNKLNEGMPASIKNLQNLKHFDISYNNMRGYLREEFADIMYAEYLRIDHNYFSGPIPQRVQDHPNWYHLWPLVVQQNDLGFSLNGVTFPAPQFETSDVDGNPMSSESIYRDNEYTVIFNWGEWTSSDRYLSLFNEKYEKYGRYGIEFLGWFAGSETYDAAAHLEEIGNKIPHARIGYDLFSDYMVPVLMIVNKEGRIIYNTITEYLAEDKLLQKLDGLTGFTDYVSTDFSKDGEVSVLQTASKGNGINIVIMGDGYSDRLIDDGTYREVMEEAMENMFSVEPYKTYRDCFNVYMVTVVSKSEKIGKGTALRTSFGEGTNVSGDHEKCMDYARLIIPDDKMKETQISVVVNSYTHHGTCYMYTGNAKTDYGSGLSIGYSTVNVNKASFRSTIVHESCGHGFAKLADEYVNRSGAISSSTVTKYNDRYRLYGWYKNVDFTSDPSAVKWSRFLSDSRYDNEDLGVFEGAFLYPYGVWRPSEDSWMRNSYLMLPFNVPSREAIYYRIHKLAYGDSWQYDYEDFVEYDAVNRSAVTRSGVPYRPAEIEELPPTSPPVVYDYSWEEEYRK